MKNKTTFSPRIFRSPTASPIWTDTTGTDVGASLETHPEELLRRISSEGFDGIWLNSLFRTLVPSSLYPDVKPDRLDVLKRLVERTGKFGINVYLLLHEPRAPREKDVFWEKHPDLKGQPFSLEYITASGDDRYPGLCSSTQAVKEFLEQSSYRLFKSLPGLGGLILVTASEYHTHCYSHYPIPQKKFSEPDMEAWSRVEFVCARCKPRRPIDVVAEIITLVNRGVKQASRDGLVIAHTWSWYLLEPDPQEALIRLLPKDVALFSDWERGGSKMLCGRKVPVDEYSYCYTGPSPRFARQCSIAKSQGRPMLAKISINRTHEFASIPYLPVPYLLAEKMRRMRRVGVRGYEGFMPFVGEMTPMTKLAGMLSQFPQPSAETAVRAMAESEYGMANAGSVCRAWRIFSRAWRHYPISIPLLYWGPMNYAPACQLERSGRKVERIAGGWLPLPRDEKGHLKVGDNLETWILDFTPDMVIASFRLLLKEWESGVSILEEGVAGCGPGSVANMKRELGLARHIQLSMRSTINIIRFYRINRRLEKARTARNDRLCRELMSIFEEESATAMEDKALISADHRLGYHPEIRENLFTIKDLDHKIALCRREMKKLEMERHTK